MSPSTTRPVWPMPRCCPTSGARRRPAFCAGPSLGSPRSGSPSSSCCPTTARVYRSELHALARRQLGIRRHLFTRPYRPRTNGKAERFIQTLVNRWAYGAIYGSSTERTAALSGWLKHYNFSRRHGSLGHKPPGARLRELTNAAGNHTEVS
jgi:Integrase core domain